MAGWCSIVTVVILAAVVFQLSRPRFSVSDLEPSLVGQVAIVTGASRGIGKGFAVGLGEAKATVYVTARTLKKGASNKGGVGGKSQKGSLEETCDLVVQAGGTCIPVAVDNGNDTHLEQLFDRVMKEQGRIDVLVNNAFAAVSHMPKIVGKPFWETGVDTWDIVNDVGLRSHYVASLLAARHMTKAKRGLIVNVGSFGGLGYIFNVAYGIGKAGMDRMANDMAIELATEGVTMVSLWPGLVKTENVEDDALGGDKLKERRGLQPGSPKMETEELLPTALSETPLFSGRAVAAFARDKRKFDHTGRVLVPALMARDYGLVDERGVRSPPFTSVKFLLATALKPYLERYGLWTIAGGCFETAPGITDRQRFFWNTLPDLAFPGAMLKLGAGAPNL